MINYSESTFGTMSAKNFEWQEQRLGIFTASEIHNIYTENGKFTQKGHSYIMKKAAECLTMEVKPEVITPSIAWGYDHENDARIEFEKLVGASGIYYGKSNPKFFSYNDYAGCSPDWEFKDEIYNIGADFKCPFNSEEHLINVGIKDSNELMNIRFEYFIQLQCSILFRGWDYAYFISYDGRFRDDLLKIKKITVTSDQRVQSNIKSSIEKAESIKQQIISQTLNR